MSQVSYEQMIHLVDQLTHDEQQALLQYLQHKAQSKTLSFEEWQTLLQSTIIRRPIVGDISPRREDWYDDEGR